MQQIYSYQRYQLRKRSHSLHTLTALRTEADCFMLRKAQAAALGKLARTPRISTLILECLLFV